MSDANGGAASRAAGGANGATGATAATAAASAASAGAVGEGVPSPRRSTGRPSPTTPEPGRGRRSTPAGEPSLTEALAGRSRVRAGFFDRPVLEVAPDLLGCVIVARGEAGEGDVAIRLTEVEAYDGALDPGSHTFRGRTARNATMFGEPGGLYVYFTYGMHHCANLVCREAGWGAGVLLRAGEVLLGRDVAAARALASRRPRTDADGHVIAPRPLPARDLARGPARLARTLGLALASDGLRPVDDPCPVQVFDRGADAAPRIATGPRVGLAGPGGGDEYPWRYWARDEPTVSVYRPAVARRRRAAGSPDPTSDGGS